MKATKILGAVLGVLMVAALFTGAVAAASETQDNSANSMAETAIIAASNIVGGALAGALAADTVYLGDVYTYALYGGYADTLDAVNATWNSKIHELIEAKNKPKLDNQTISYIISGLKILEPALFSATWTSVDGKGTIVARPEKTAFEMPIPITEEEVEIYKGLGYIVKDIPVLGNVSIVPVPITRYTFIADSDKCGEYYCDALGKRFTINLKAPTVALYGDVYKNQGGLESLISIASLIDGTVDINDDAFKIEAGTIYTGGLLSTYISNIIDVLKEIPDKFSPTDKGVKEYFKKVIEAVENLKLGNSPDGIVFTNPAGSLTTVNIPGLTPSELLSTPTKLVYTDLAGMDLGKWTAQAYFSADGIQWSRYAPKSMIFGDKYYFTAVDSENTKTLTVSSDKITQGGYVTVTVKAPYGDWPVSVGDLDIQSLTNPVGEIPGGQMDMYDISGQPMTEAGQAAYIHIGTSGEGSFVVKSLTTDDMKIALYDKEEGFDKTIKQVTVKVNAGAITATVGAEKVYIGNEFDVSGTNDLGGTLHFFVKGTNYNLATLMDGTGFSASPITTSGNIWKKTIDTEDFSNSWENKYKRPDAGTYTIYIAKLAKGVNPDQITKTENFDDADLVDAYTTVTVALLQPFVTVDIADVVVQGEKLEISGTAEGNPSSVGIYVFGTNFFKAESAAVLTDDSTYSFSKKILAPENDAGTVKNNAWNMAAGQYFVVVQHPMYDGAFNVVADSKDIGAKIYKNEKSTSDKPIVSQPSVAAGWYELFDTSEKQSANAAYALEVAIADENIDDMQAHKSFIVKAPNSDVNAVPSQVQQGQKLVISGVTSGHSNEMVSVELLSTAFAATSKEAAGSAAFATLTTRIGEDGKWTVTFDTTNMNCDDYTVSIAVGQLDPVTAKTKIVKASSVTPTTKPTTTPTTNPTAKPTTTPKTPGFGALAALVGLGAVAVLLLRRE